MLDCRSGVSRRVLPALHQCMPRCSQSTSLNLPSWTASFGGPEQARRAYGTLRLSSAQIRDWIMIRSVRVCHVT